MATASVLRPIGEGKLRWASSKSLSRDKKECLGDFFFFCFGGPGSRQIIMGNQLEGEQFEQS